MSNVEISDSNELKVRKDNEEMEIGELYGDKGYSKVPLDQINLNTEPISIVNDFNYSFFDFDIKPYVKVFLGFAVFVIILFTISILSGHFHYHKDDVHEIKDLKNVNIYKIPLKEEDNISKSPIQPNNQTINENINITNKNNSINNDFKKKN